MSVVICGIVAKRNKEPYLQIKKDNEIIVQLTMAEARNVAHDILTGCARTEADAMLYRFFKLNNLPEDAANHMMILFRDYRYKLDNEPVERFAEDPENSEKI